MALSYDAALALPPVEVTQAYTERDTILYALGIGLGADPLNPTELAYVYEGCDLKVLPTMPVAMAFKSLREMNLGIDYSRLVHGEQSLKIHRPMPTKGVVLGRSRVADVIDRGKEKGAMVLIEREITDELPRQRNGVTPQMHGRYPDYNVLDQAGHWDDVIAAIKLARKVQLLLPGYPAQVQPAICHPFTSARPRLHDYFRGRHTSAHWSARRCVLGL